MRDIEIRLDPSGNVVVASERPKTLQQRIIESNVKYEIIANKGSDKKFWSKETRIASTLIKKYPSPDFWVYFELPYKLNSLAFLLSERGNNEVKKQFSSWDLTRIDKGPIISEDKVGEDRIFEKKNKVDIFEF